MNREIKFRVWVESILEEETGMYVPDYISWMKNGDNHNIDKIYTKEFKFKDDTCKFTAMQYTGLKDKNGKEIYEGDVVQQLGVRYEIRWANGGFQPFVMVEGDEGNYLHSAGVPLRDWNWIWMGKNGDSSIYHHGESGRVQPLEIIGNIYENPELTRHDGDSEPGDDHRPEDSGTTNEKVV